MIKIRHDDNWIQVMATTKLWFLFIVGKYGFETITGIN